MENKTLIVTDIARSKEEHIGYDSAFNGLPLYSFKFLNGKECPNSLYGYEIEEVNFKMKTFQLTENIQAVADYGKTRNGFKHEATILKNGSEVGFAKVNYLNRTWEAYEYQTAIKKLLIIQLFQQKKKRN